VKIVWEELVGRRSDPVENWVERGAVKRFAQAIGDVNAIYYDDNAARRSGHGRLIAPPTFPVTFDYGAVPGLNLPVEGLIHGAQTFRYQRPLYVGDQLECYLSFDKTFVKQGSQGALTFLALSRIGRDTAGDIVFSSSTTIIVTETVMRRIAG
jgi:acyl dehydratase